jgi:hypothetical protein
MVAARSTPVNAGAKLTVMMVVVVLSGLSSALNGS